MIRFAALSKSYGETRALEGLTFQVGAGEIVGLVGKNGAGKSTALKILSCQLLPSAGDVTVEGMSVQDFPLTVRGRLGYLPEQPPLYPEMTVSAYLDFAARLRGLNAVQARSRRHLVMDETALAEVAGERLGNLSRGYQQRVGIAQAIVHQPRVVVLDEPMAGLDPLQIVQVRELIRGLRHRHTVLFSSHILAEITRVCDRVVLIDGGTVRAEGSEAELWTRLAARRRLVLAARADPARLRAALAAVPGLEIEAVQAGEGGQGAITARLSAAADVREAVARACVEAGLGLLELRTERHGLEALFMQLLGAAPGEGASRDASRAADRPA